MPPDPEKPDTHGEDKNLPRNGGNGVVGTGDLSKHASFIWN